MALVNCEIFLAVPQEGGCEYLLVGDLNDDCKVDIFDVALMAANWLIDCNLTPENLACVLKGP